MISGISNPSASINPTQSLYILSETDIQDLEAQFLNTDLVDDLVSLLKESYAVRSLRVLGSLQVPIMDHKLPNRVNIHVDQENIIQKISCG